MNEDTDSFVCRSLPQFLTEIELLLDSPNTLSDSQIKEPLRCSDALAEKKSTGCGRCDCRASSDGRHTIHHLYFLRARKGQAHRKGDHVQIARGEIVRYMAGNMLEEPEDMKVFDRLGYRFSRTHSDETHYVFIKEEHTDAWNRNSGA